MSTKNARKPKHPIAVVAERTTLSPDVLRVWERRYQAVEPTRSATGRRLYSDADVERLALLRMVTLAGRSISQVARRDTVALRRLVREDDEARHHVRARHRTGVAADEHARALEGALDRARALDAWGLEAVLRRSAALLGAAAFLDDTVLPFLQRIELERDAGRLSPASERLARAIVRRVLDGVMLALAVPDGAPNLLVATPAGEREEIEAIVTAAVASAEGWRVTYLGADVLARDIVGAATSAGVRAVGVTVAHLADHARTVAELRSLRAGIPADVPLIVGGAGAAALAPDVRAVGIRVVKDLPALRIALRAVGKASMTTVLRSMRAPGRRRGE